MGAPRPSARRSHASMSRLHAPARRLNSPEKATQFNRERPNLPVAAFRFARDAPLALRLERLRGLCGTGNTQMLGHLDPRGIYGDMRLRKPQVSELRYQRSTLSARQLGNICVFEPQSTSQTALMRASASRDCPAANTHMRIRSAQRRLPRQIHAPNTPAEHPFR